MAWYARETRGDVLGDVCLLQQSLVNPTLAEVRAANRVVKRFLEEPLTIVFHHHPNGVRFLSSSDSAWANASGFRSQKGHSVWAADRKGIAGEGSVMTPIYWNSRKEPRVVNSTLSAEAMGCSEALDHLDYVCASWAELNSEAFCIRDWIGLAGASSDPYADFRQGIITVDAKSLFDAVSNFGTSRPACKRTCLEVALISDLVSRSGHVMRWVPTSQMLSDTLTKVGRQGSRFVDVVGGAIYSLSERASDITRDMSECVLFLGHRFLDRLRVGSASQAR